jgi:hypothetical protein
MLRRPSPACGGHGLLPARRSEIAEEIRLWANDHPRIAAFQSGFIGLHRAIEGEEIGILAEALGENPVPFRIPFAAGLVGLAPRIAEQHDDVAIGLGFNGLLLLGAFGTKFVCLACALALHALKNLFGDLPRQIRMANSHIDSRDA